MAKTEGKTRQAVYINSVSENLIHDVTLPSGEVRKSISGNFRPNEMCSFLVRPGAVKPSTKINGAENIGYKNVYLGSPNTHFEVRSKVKVNGQYPKPWKMTAQELKDAWDANNAAYRAARKEAFQKKLENPRETPEAVVENIVPANDFESNGVE